MIKKLLLGLIRFYQAHLNFNNSLAKSLFLTDRACRFTPTCSAYAHQAIETHGILRGLFLSLKRIIRCHPWSKGGWDPIKVKSLKFKV
ncbi:membrane protein insertion efficiency factor YidD [Candidatus Shapirobacteria bacterium]|nr:membrane protein insertion efficiency factor YidD [Candidatus Shapirobacteria bacterium]